MDTCEGCGTLFVAVHYSTFCVVCINSEVQDAPNKARHVRDGREVRDARNNERQVCGRCRDGEAAVSR